MNTTLTDLDYVAGVLVVIIVLASALTLFGMVALMTIGAMSSNRPLVTSWPADQEQAFVPFERSGAASNTRAWTISLIGCAVFTLFAVGVYVGVSPDKKDIAKDMNMSNLTKKRGPAAPKPDPAAKSDSAAPAEAPKPDTTAPEPKQ